MAERGLIMADENKSSSETIRIDLLQVDRKPVPAAPVGAAGLRRPRGPAGRDRLRGVLWVVCRRDRANRVE